MNNPDVNFVFIDGYPLDDDPDPNEMCIRDSNKAMW